MTRSGIRHARRCRYDAGQMDPIGHALFDTAIGACAIAWSPRGVVALQLPESSGERTVARLVALVFGLCFCSDGASVAAETWFSCS